MAPPASQYIAALCAVCAHVRETGDWVVIVASDRGGFAGDLLKALTAVRTPDMVLGGTTLLLPEGGRVSVVSGSRDVSGEGYLVMFLGYDGELTPRDEIAFHSWRQKATGTLTLSERSGELRINRT